MSVLLGDRFLVPWEMPILWQASEPNPQETKQESHGAHGKGWEVSTCFY